MKKKKIIKKKAISPISHYYIRYIITPALILVFVITAKIAIKSFTQPMVLGTSTYLLASDNATSDGTMIPPSTGRVNSSRVDCIGPDGKHFQTGFTDCQRLNDAWHHTNFSYTPLTNTQDSLPGSDTSEKASQSAQINHMRLPKTMLLRTNTNNQEIQIKQENATFQMTKEGDKTGLKVQKNDGIDIELNQNDTLPKLNQLLKDKGIELGTSSANQYFIRNGATEAQTDLPISLNPQTQKLTVTTSTGVKDITVLPDQAVNSLIHTNVINTIETKVIPDTQASSGAILNNKVTLTSLNNQPVFSISGISDKKLFGVFSIKYAKTVYVSTETGQILKINETPFTKLLESVSF